MSPSIPTEQIWAKAFILSFLLHILVVRLFIFVWPLKGEGPRPTLVFFGAVLEKSELAGIGIPESDQRLILQPRRIKYQPEHSVAPYDDRDVSKPAYPKAIRGKSKPVPKVNYMPAPEAAEPDPPQPALEDTLPAAPIYQPLRLQPK